MLFIETDVAGAAGGLERDQMSFISLLQSCSCDFARRLCILMELVLMIGSCVRVV